MTEPSGSGPQDWIGQQIRVELVRPGGESAGGGVLPLIGTPYFGELIALTEHGIVAALVELGQNITRSPRRERFYPWSAVLSIELAPQ